MTKSFCKYCNPNLNPKYYPNKAIYRLYNIISLRYYGEIIGKIDGIILEDCYFNHFRYGTCSRTIINTIKLKKFQLKSFELTLDHNIFSISIDSLGGSSDLLLRNVAINEISDINYSVDEMIIGEFKFTCL